MSLSKGSFSKCKGLMIGFNILFMLCGLAVVGLGIWIVVDSNAFAGALAGFGTSFKYIGYVAIGFGSLIAIVAFIGCCGALTENKCLLGMFTCFMVFFLTITIAITAFCFVVAFIDLEGILKSPTENFMKAAYTGNDTVTIDLIDKMHTEFSCCGFTNGSIFETVPVLNEVPSSCCKSYSSLSTAQKTTCLDDSLTNPTAAATIAVSNAGTGCFSQIQEFIKTYMYAIGGGCLGAILVEILAIIFSCCVSSSINKSVGPWSK